MVCTPPRARSRKVSVGLGGGNTAWGVVNGFHQLNPRMSPSAECLCALPTPSRKRRVGLLTTFYTIFAWNPVCLHEPEYVMAVGWVAGGRAVKGQTSVWIGATRTSTANVGGWAWVDGTDASILNCGRNGCGLWINNEPGYVAATGGGRAKDCLDAHGFTHWLSTVVTLVQCVGALPVLPARAPRESPCR